TYRYQTMHCWIGYTTTTKRPLKNYIGDIGSVVTSLSCGGRGILCWRKTLRRGYLFPYGKSGRIQRYGTLLLTCLSPYVFALLRTSNPRCRKTPIRNSFCCIREMI